MIFGAVVYLLYKIAQGAGDFSERFSQAWKQLKSQATIGWSSIVPRPEDMPGTMKQHYDEIKAGEPNLNTPNPNRAWYLKTPGELWDSIFSPAPSAPVTAQTVGTAATPANVTPFALRMLTPLEQPGGIGVPPTATTGTSNGTLSSNQVAITGTATKVNGVTYPDESYDPMSSGIGITPNRGPTTPPSDIDTSQLQILY